MWQADAAEGVRVTMSYQRRPGLPTVGAIAGDADAGVVAHRNAVGGRGAREAVEIARTAHGYRHEARTPPAQPEVRAYGSIVR